MTEKEGVISDYFGIIQNVITRMAQNSFLIKGWTVIILAAIIVLTFSIINIIIFSVLLLIITMFWILDSYYLKLERLYRRLYNSKVDEYNDSNKKNKMVLFDMNYKPFVNQEQKIPRIMFSKSEAYFYIPLIVVILIFLIYSIIVFLEI